MNAPGAPNAEEVEALLAGLPEGIHDLFHGLVGLIVEVRPDLSARVRLGWRSVNFRHPQAGFVCALFPHPDRVSLVFEHGRQLSDPEGLLEGNGRQVRFVNLVPGAALPEAGIALLIAEAVALRA
jgi:hypothetical protein